ncbi:MAG: aspartyl/asparaginyl beta-hydroxylase (cupin superfamily) [Halioglobus sp.]|jgi:aspartyl/asparaginyl beta-hydroxylase (cupin superfamily)
MGNRGLESEIDRAFSQRNDQEGLQLLRVLSASRPEDAETHHRLAVVEEQIGVGANATAAHLQCLKYSPTNPLAYLYAGYWFHKLGRKAEALSLYSLGIELTEMTTAPGDVQALSPETGRRFDAAMRAVREHLSEQHRSIVGPDESNRRISEAVWTRTHDKPFSFPDSGQKPQLLCVPGLPTSIKRERMPWVSQLEELTADIKEELLAAMPRVVELGRPYLPAGMSAQAGFGSLVGSMDWTALDLFREGERQADILPLFPKTHSALSHIPLYGLTELPYEVFFSVLKPGQHIRPHYGLSNHSLTVHLPLIVPDNCWLTVNGEKQGWKEGEALLFDDTFLHEAVNNSPEVRVVLIFSVWHPDLSEGEQQALKRTIQARSDWFSARAVPVQV